MLHFKYKKRAPVLPKARIPRKKRSFTAFIVFSLFANGQKTSTYQSIFRIYCALLDLSRYVRAERAQLTLKKFVAAVDKMD